MTTTTVGCVAAIKLYTQKLQELSSEYFHASSSTRMEEINRQATECIEVCSNYAKQGPMLLKTEKDKNHPNSVLYHSQLLSTTMQKYHQILQQYKNIVGNRDRRNIKYALQLCSANNSKSIENEEQFIDQLVAQGRAHSFFQQALVAGDSLLELTSLVEKRHVAIAQLEKDILEIHQLFIDLETIVDQQSDLVNHIGHHINIATDATNAGAIALEQGARYQKQLRNRRCCFLILLFLFILIVILVPLIVIKVATV